MPCQMRVTKVLFHAFALVAITLYSPAQAQQQPKDVRLLMNWFAQPDQGGYWQAQLDDAGKAVGLRITTLQGGPRIQTIPQVAAGQAEFGIGNADDVLLARLHGAPVRAVFASLDYVPYTLVYHPDPDVKSPADLKDRTFAVNIGAAYWEWLKMRYGLENVRQIPVSGDLSLFKTDNKLVQQGYSIFLPARMAAAGIPYSQFKVPQLGYRPYDVLFTTDELIDKNPKLVRDVVAAVRASWDRFISDPSAVKRLVLKLNQQMTPAVYDAAVAEMISDLLPKASKIGCMADDRWKELARQLKELNFLPASFDEKKAYNLSFVQGCTQ